MNQRSHRVTLLETAWNGTARLNTVDLKENNVPSANRLLDTETQVDFYLGRIKVLCNAIEAHGVIGEPNIFVVRHRLPSIVDSSAPHHYLNSSEHPSEGNLANYIGTHLNYHKRRYSHFFENIHADISYLNCINDRMKVWKALAVAQISRIQAAQIFGLPECYALDAVSPKAG